MIWSPLVAKLGMLPEQEPIVVPEPYSMAIPAPAEGPDMVISRPATNVPV